jgi:3-oxoacyl-[acyl-carrier protein] reductase
VVVNYRTNAGGAEEVRDAIQARGGSCLVKRFDVSERAEVVQAIDEVTEAVGPIGVLVNNARTAKAVSVRAPLRDLRPIWEMADAEWDELVATNLTGMYNCTRQVVKIMLERKLPEGRLINIASVTGEVGHPVGDHDSAATSGLIGFTKSLARGLAPKNITATVVSPGFIATDTTASLPHAPDLSSIPLRRVGQPEEVAAAVSFLASVRASYITGEVIRVDGGMYM